MLSVIVPAHDEEALIGRCIGSVLAQSVRPEDAGGLELIVVANGCRDRTAAEAREHAATAEAAGWRLEVLDLAEGGKPNAFDHGDAAAAEGGVRVYLDADVTLDPDMLARLHAALDRPDPAWASGRMVVAEAESWVTRRFMALWRRVPFMTASGATGAGLFAVNPAGRARWGAFPRIISDDTFVRLQFAPEERHEVDAAFLWPPVEGFAALVKVRRRQDAGVAELRDLHPELFENEGKPAMTLADHARLFLGTPVSYVVYVAVMLAVKFGGRQTAEWTRGR